MFDTAPGTFWDTPRELVTGLGFCYFRRSTACAAKLPAPDKDCYALERSAPRSRNYCHYSILILLLIYCSTLVVAQHLLVNM